MPDADDTLNADLDLAVEVAREAGKLSLEWLEKGAKSWDKSPGNVVTEADIAVNDLIAKRLRAARPDDGWLSEETKDDPVERRQQRVWVVDPIDGTKAFVRGEPGFSISIARLEGNRPVVAALFNPLTREMFAASEGRGAVLNGDRITAPRTCELGGCGMILRPEMYARLSAHPGWPKTRLLTPMPNSIAYRIALVAAGQWDAAIGLGKTNDWDIAAAILILKEAGGVATDGYGERFVFNQPVTKHPGIVAAGAGLHALIMEKLQGLSRPA
ncbi:MAG: 3'(2'),5'-bisphosphate nucleotidase CysQ [Hyphomonadaceae bacterium]|nr:3'(2'),5'-bisphosphate nucleotidase CysQ [Hyphomonadaceae bacterium]